MSAESSSVQQEVRKRVLTPIAADLEARASELASLLVDGFRSEMPELYRDAETVEAARAGAEASIQAVARGLAADVDLGSLELPLEAIAYARDSARQGVPRALLLRTYRLGHAALWNLLVPKLAARASSTDELSVATDLASATLFAYVDVALVLAEEAYASERERFARSAAAVRAEAIAGILSGALSAAPAAGRRLRHDLERTHVGMWAWLDHGPEAGDAYELLEAALTKLAGTAGLAEPLMQPMGTYAIAAWISVAEAPDTAALAAARLSTKDFPGIRLAVGEPAEGVEGFRATHAQASSARRVATLARRPAGSVTRYANVALQALASGDIEHAREFVARELGPLAVGDDLSRRLSATLDVYLDEHASRSRAAHRLGVHENTISYRIKQVEEILGRSVADHTLSLRVALALAPLVREHE